MAKELKKTSAGKGDEKLTFSKRIKKGDKSTEITVKQVENGYVVCVCKTEDGKDGWKYEEKEYISMVNPLAKAAEEDLDLGLDDMLSDFSF